MLKKINGWIEERLRFLKITEYGYKVNKKITWSAFLICVALLGVIVSVDGFGVLFGATYAECPSYSLEPCVNPFESQECIAKRNVNMFANCELVYLQAGESYGTKPSWLARNFNWLVVVIMGLSILINHLIYNRKWRFENVKRH